MILLGQGIEGTFDLGIGRSLWNIQSLIVIDFGVKIQEAIRERPSWFSFPKEKSWVRVLRKGGAATTKEESLILFQYYDLHLGFKL